MRRSLLDLIAEFDGKSVGLEQAGVTDGLHNHFLVQLGLSIATMQKYNSHEPKAVHLCIERTIIGDRLMVWPQRKSGCRPKQ
jgi:hypothetical protein